MIQHSSIPCSALRRGACAVALLSAVSVPALAETNVAIYGIIDAGLLYQSRTDPDGKSKTSMETSGLRQSVLGFKGDRDLGRGLEGFFNLEVHYDTNNGKLHGTGDAQGTGTPFFRRQANLGLRGDLRDHRRGPAVPEPDGPGRQEQDVDGNQRPAPVGAGLQGRP